MLQLFEQGQNLAAYRYIEGAGWFIANNQARFDSERSRNRNALPLPTGKFMGITIEAIDRQANPLHQLQHPLMAFWRPRLNCQAHHRFFQDVADTHTWIQGGIGILEDELDIAPQFAQLAAGAPPDELLTGGAPIYNLYRCQDGGWVSVAALEPPFLAVLQTATDDLSAEGLARLFASAPRDAWLERLGGACVMPVLTLPEVATNPHVASRGLFEDGLPHPPTGPVSGPVPRLGEHTEAELRRVGYVPA